MNIFKKVIASIALTTLMLSMITTGVSAASTELTAANKLAADGVINDNSANPANYNLGNNVLRQEIAKVAANIAGLTPNATANNSFSDVSATTPNTWAFGYVEALLDANLISSNAKFNPEANISKAEALKMMLEAAGYTNVYNNATTWQAETVAFAVQKGVITTSFTDYKANANRGWIFLVGSDAIDSMDNTGTDLLGALLGNLGDPVTDTPTTDTPTNTGTTTPTTPTDTTTTPVVSGSPVLNVNLSPDTAVAATIPRGISGLPVASFDFTAGSEDVTVNSIVVRRAGLSDAATITGLAIFDSEGRVSKSKNDTQNNNTEATLTLDNGGIVVMAGETKTLTIVADVNTLAATTGAEFAIEIIEVNASNTVEGINNLVANTMKVGGVTAETLTVGVDGTFSNPKIGEVGADIFKFKVTGSNSRDMLLKAITFKGEGTIDEADELSNYKLLNGTTVVATANANGKYVTFNFADGFTIAEDQNERFTVTADILAGANKTISFRVAKTLDVSGEDTLYGFGANVDITAVTATDSLGNQTVQAGEITLVDIDATNDKIRANKSNVELGSINITNVSGNNLELQKFGVDVTLSAGTLANTFVNFEAVINGTSYALSEVAGGYADPDLSISLPQGTTKIVLRADTLQGVVANTTVDVALTTINTQFFVVELGDDIQVTDLTPSSLSFKQLKFLTATATASVTPTAASIQSVRGSKGIISNVFTLKASEASNLTMDEIKAKVTMLAGANATSQEVAKISLYKDSVSNANLLDQVSGSQLASGVATFNGFVVDLMTNDTRTFVVTIDFVDSASATTNSNYNTTITSISLFDDESNNVFVTGANSTVNLVSSTALAVTDAGTLTVTYDANNDANKYAKTVLAGTSEVVYTADVRASNEDADVEKVVFTLSSAGTVIKSSISNATLLLDGNMITSNANADIILGTPGVNKVDTVTLAGTAGTGSIDTNAVTFNTNLSTTAIDFVTTNSGTYLTSGVILTSSGADLIFTANVAGTTFTSPVIVNSGITSTLVNTTANGAVTNDTIEFTNLTNLIIPTTTAELGLKLNTADMGKDKVGKVIAGVTVTDVTVSLVTGVDSGKVVTGTLSATAAGVAFTVAPATVMAAVNSNFAASTTATFDLVAANGTNTAANGSTSTTIVSKLVFSDLGNASVTSYVLKDDSDVVLATANVAGGNATFSGFSINVSSTKALKIVVTTSPTATTTSYGLTLKKDGITYAVNGGANVTSNTASTTPFGAK